MLQIQETPDDFPVMQMVRTSRIVRMFARLTFIALLLSVIAMIFVPWRQTARGVGTVVALDPQQRPQAVLSPSKGVVSFVKPGLREGSYVEKDDLLLRLSPFAVDGVMQIDTQIVALESKEAAALSSLEVAKQSAELQVSSGQSMTESLKQDYQAAKQKWEQARNEVTSLQAELEDKRNQLSIAEEVAAQGLVSREELFSKRQAVQSQQAKVLKAENAVEEAYASLLSKEEEIESKMQEIDIKNRTANQKVLESMQEINTIEKEIMDVRNKRGELDRLEIRAPRSGHIQQWFGVAGSDTVKEGDRLFVIVPDTEELAVEMKVSGNDMPLIHEGDRVRLQFEGWPAVQFVGWPSVAVGTFGGKVNRVFPTDDGMGNFRVVVTPDNHFDREDGWPNDRYLRQGVRQRLGAAETSSTRIRDMASVERISPGRGRRGSVEGQRQVQRQGQQSQIAKIMIVAARFFVGCVVAVSLSASVVRGQNVREPDPDQSYPQFLSLLQENADGSGLVDSDATDRDFENGSETIPLGDPESNQSPLSLADVIASLYRSYPDIARARQQTDVAGGELTSAYGAYDTKVGVYSLSEALGFYENYRHGLGVARQTWWGGYVAAGYRIGRGSFQPWYKERQTNQGGEFKVGVTQPLLRGRAVDPQRVALFQASIDQQASQTIVQQAILDTSREATSLYWQWVASGAILEAQRELLALAEKRGEQFEAGVKAGKFAEIDLILNQQLIAERRTNVLESEQKFRTNALKLGLYLRDDAGRPLVPSDLWLPKQFPVIEPPPPSNLQDDLAAALARRPEPQILQYELRQLQLDRRLACNDLLPRLDLVAEASQDVGRAVSDPNDKGEFQLVLGFQSEVPIQRRKARGKIQSTAAKQVQINEKIRLVQNKIATELQTAYTRLLLSSQVVDQSELSLCAALETLERYRFGFTKGKIDLIYLNLVETKANETEIKLVEAQRSWFDALSQMQIALGLDPLDQAITISSLPPSDMPGPGNLPTADQVKQQDPNEN